jgi:hypothetical protein
VKKLTSIALIVLLLLNVLGYYGVFVGLQYKNDREITKRLDTDIYSGSETVTIEIPVSIPYAVETSEFQRVDGKFEYQGAVYRMVKQRFANGTLFVVCIKDAKATQLNEALRDYVQTFADAPADSKSETATHLTLIKDYIKTSYSLKPSSEGWTSVVCHQTRPPVFIASFCASIVHPPERG